MSSGDIEEASDVGDILWVCVSFPRKHTVKAKLPGLANCTYHPDDCLLHAYSFPLLTLSRSLDRARLKRLFLLTLQESK
jgi:hypothetical protein